MVQRPERENTEHREEEQSLELDGLASVAEAIFDVVSIDDVVSWLGD